MKIYYAGSGSKGHRNLVGQVYKNVNILISFSNFTKGGQDKLLKIIEEIEQLKKNYNKKEKDNGVRKKH